MPIRKAFIMYLNPGCEAEYKQRHDNIWPEMHALLRSHGVSNYSISLCTETNQLFAYAEVANEDQWQRIANTDECRKWWEHMSDIMKTNGDNSPVATDLKEVFYME